MITRSKARKLSASSTASHCSSAPSNNDFIDPQDSDVDEQGNIKDLIDYTEEDEKQDEQKIRGLVRKYMNKIIQNNINKKIKKLEKPNDEDLDNEENLEDDEGDEDLENYDEDDDEDDEDDEDDDDDEEYDTLLDNTQKIVVSLEAEETPIKIVNVNIESTNVDIEEINDLVTDDLAMDEVNSLEDEPIGDIDVNAEPVIVTKILNDFVNTIESEITVEESKSKDVYRNMNTNQLKQLVITKGLTTNPSKLKKNELLQLLENVDL